MCIIAISEKGKQLPSDETIATMFRRNDDGAGMMWAEDNKVHIRKGFMKIEDFMNFLNEWKTTHDAIGTAVVMHFRISTAVGVNPQCTHPFPIDKNPEELKLLSYETNIGVAHNGIIDITPRKGISDTMEYIVSQLALIKKIDKNFLENDDCMDLISNAIGSKMAFLNQNGDVYTIGAFNEDKETGCLYSNYTWENYSYNYGCYGGKSSNYPYGYAYADDYYDDGYYGYKSYGAKSQNPPALPENSKKDAKAKVEDKKESGDDFFDKEMGLFEVSVNWVDPSNHEIYGLGEDEDPADVFFDEAYNFYVMDEDDFLRYSPNIYVFTKGDYDDPVFDPDAAFDGYGYVV